MTIQTFTRAASIEPSAWNEIVAADRVICRHEYLAAVEESDVNDCRYFYPVVYQDGRIAAHTCLYFISTELDSFAQGLLKRSITLVRKAWTDFLILHSIECGTPVALGNTLSFREGVDRKAALRLIVRETERLAGEMGVGVVLFRDFYESELGFYDALAETGYVRIRNLPGTRLILRWKTFKDYLASMRSHYRHNVLKRMKTFSDAGGTLEILTEFSAVSEELARLWRNAYDHAREYRREMLKPEFFGRMDAGLGKRSSVLLARIKGKPAGFSLLLGDDGTLIWMFCGLDYAFNEDCAVYFNMLYKIVELGIEGGFKEADLGITTVIPKMDIGADVVPLFMYMKHLNPLLAPVVPRLFRMMTPSPEFPPRKVFRGNQGLSAPGRLEAGEPRTTGEP